MMKLRNGRALAAPCAVLAVGAKAAWGQEPGAVTSISQEEQSVFEAVLDSWLGPKPANQMINQRLNPAPSLSDPENTECAKGLSFSQSKVVGQPDASLVGVKFKREGLRLVDGDQWSADDQALQESVGKGKFKPSELDRAFAHSLSTFSRAVFSEDGRNALVEFSHVCGSLCGSGSTLLMHKLNGRWKIAKRCGGWIS
jgi:hypothetical protein